MAGEELDKNKVSNDDKIQKVDGDISDAKKELERLKGLEKNDTTEKQITELETKLKSLEEDKQKITQETQAYLGDEKPKPTKEDDKKSKASKEEVSLNQLKKDIESGKMSFDLTKAYLENLDKLEDKNFKPYILGGILSGLNQRGVSIEGIIDGKITLKAGIQSLRENLNIATHEETVRYQNLLNNHLNTGTFSITDLNKSLMYRTSSIDNYLEEKVEGQETSTSGYVLRLLEKYKITVSGPSLENFTFETEVQYTSLKNMIKSSITDNQADKEFLLAYFDDIYFKKNGIEENAIEDYKKSSTKIEKGVSEGLNKLSEDQKYALGIKSEDDAEELKRKMKNDPVNTTLKMITSGGVAGLLLGILLSFKFGWGGFFAGFLGGSLLAGGGAVVAGEMLNKGMDKAEEKFSGKSLNEITKKYSGLFTENIGTLKKEELNDISTKLLNNSDFLKSDSANLNIFTNGTKQENIDNYFKSIGLVLNEKNKLYYEEIFKLYIKKRKKDGINDPIIGENIYTYLTKTTNNTQKSEDKPEENKKVTKETLKELNVDGKESIIGLLKSNKYGNLTIETLEKLYNDTSNLEATFKAYGQSNFYKKYKDSILQIIKIIIDSEPDKSKKLKDFLK